MKAELMSERFSTQVLLKATYAKAESGSQSMFKCHPNCSHWPLSQLALNIMEDQLALNIMEDQLALNYFIKNKEDWMFQIQPRKCYVLNLLT